MSDDRLKRDSMSIEEATISNDLPGPNWSSVHVRLDRN